MGSSLSNKKVRNEYYKKVIKYCVYKIIRKLENGVKNDIPRLATTKNGERIMIKVKTNMRV